MLDKHAEQDDFIGGKVLIVEDEFINQTVLREILKESGISPVVAKSGEEALDLVNQFPPDLILLDIVLGRGIDGLEVCRRLREQPRFRELPILFVSSLNESEDRQRGFEAGGTDYITKPYQRDEVLARVLVHLKQGIFRRAIKHSAEEFSNQSSQSTLREQALSQIDNSSDSPVKRLHSMEPEYQELASLIEMLKVQKVELQLQNQQLLEMEQQQVRHVSHLKMYFDLHPVASLQIDTTGQISQANLAARKLIGIGQLQAHNNQLSPYLNRPELWPEIKSHLEASKNHQWETVSEITAVDGSSHQVRMIASICHLPDHTAAPTECQVLLALIPL